LIICQRDVNGGSATTIRHRTTSAVTARLLPAAKASRATISTHTPNDAALVDRRVNSGGRRLAVSIGVRSLIYGRLLHD
jgi:hypothetical protein